MKPKVAIPNRSIGGLLLMHSLYAASTFSVVPRHLREMFKEYLAWVGRVMGIGQARVLADVSTRSRRPSDPFLRCVGANEFWGP